MTPGKTWPEGTPIAFPLEDLSGLPSNLLLLAVVGDDDFVLDVDARKDLPRGDRRDSATEGLNVSAGLK